MKQTITLIILFIGLNFYAQTTFKKGYFIAKDGEKQEVHFKAFGSEIPKTIYYKKNDKYNSIDPENINELFIPEKIKFIRKKVNLELLNKGMKSKITNNSKNFLLVKKELLLKVLLEFNTNKILSYLDENNNRYLFIDDNESIKLLEYKIYTKNKKNFKVNNFRNFLYKKYKSKDKISKLKYTEKGIVNYLKTYSSANNINYKEYEGFYRDFKDIFNITPKAGVSLIEQTNSSYNNVGNYDSNFKESQISFGFDFEYFFNTKIKHSSIIASYNYYTKVTNKEKFSFAQQDDSEINNTMNSSDLQLKFRRYFKITNQQNVYANAGVLLHMSSGETKYDYINTNANIADLRYNNAENNIAFIFGVGYNIKNLYLEANYIPKIEGKFDTLNTIATLSNWGYTRNMLSISIGYNLF